MNIVILTKKYGINFTGATIATHEFAHRWILSKEVDKITVLAKEIGDYKKDSDIIVLNFRNFKDFKLKLKNYSNFEKDIFYSDDHLGYYFSKLNLDYYHTYHGNWPDAKYLNIEFYLKSFYFIPLYKRTIKEAKEVINVSKYMEQFTKKSNNNSVLIRNGIKMNGTIIDKNIKKKRCLMIGNIDKRKYGKLIPMIESAKKKKYHFIIDIYGKVCDEKIFQVLNNSSFINFKGFQNKIDFNNYDLLLCTSISENLPISICEALKAGLPVFSFSVGGISELINENNGLLVESFDTGVLLDGIVKYLNNNTILNENQDYKEFDWGYASKKYLDLFREN